MSRIDPRYRSTGVAYARLPMTGSGWGAGVSSALPSFPSETEVMALPDPHSISPPPLKMAEN